MNFHLITIFPEIFSSYLDESILGRAQESDKIKIEVYNLREYADVKDKRKSVDDTPCGGGPGMVMQVEPIYKCVEGIKSKIKKESKGDGMKRKTLVILTAAKGNIYKQAKAEEIKNDFTDVIIICGRYEGVDERVAKYVADEEISIGQYILTGGELPAMIIVDSVSRLISGVLGNEESLTSESYNESKSNETSVSGDIKFDYPVYTRPVEFNNWKVPDILLSGNHQKINEWRENSSQMD